MRDQKLIELYGNSTITLYHFNINKIPKYKNTKLELRKKYTINDKRGLNLKNNLEQQQQHSKIINNNLKKVSKKK